MDRLSRILRVVSLTLLLAIKMFGGNATAHAMWLNVSDYSPSKGGNAIVYFGWGHKYPVRSQYPLYFAKAQQIVGDDAGHS